MCLQVGDQMLLSRTTKYTAMRLGDKVPTSAPRGGKRMLGWALTSLLVQVQDRLGISPRLVAAPFGLEPGPQGGVVVDLPIIGDPHCPILVRHGLGATRDVDDGETAVAETDGAVDPEPFAVRATVTEHVSHPLETGSVRRLPAVELQDPDDSTHAG
jgi:hypothetical protein